MENLKCNKPTLLGYISKSQTPAIGLYLDQLCNAFFPLQNV